MIIGGSICTLLYIFVNKMLPYELPIRSRSLFLKANMMFYLLPLPWMAVKLKDRLRPWLKNAGIDLLRAEDADYTIHPNRIWESMIVKDGYGRILYITGYEKWIPAILAQMVLAGKMVIMVSHRLSTITEADHIMVMEDGQIIAEGVHEKLIKECARYKKLYGGKNAGNDL